MRFSECGPPEMHSMHQDASKLFFAPSSQGQQNDIIRKKSPQEAPPRLREVFLFELVEDQMVFGRLSRPANVFTTPPRLKLVP
jgi:hypothetical protein